MCMYEYNVYRRYEITYRRYMSTAGPPPDCYSLYMLQAVMRFNWKWWYTHMNTETIPDLGRRWEQFLGSFKLHVDQKGQEWFQLYLKLIHTVVTVLSTVLLSLQQLLNSIWFESLWLPLTPECLCVDACARACVQDRAVLKASPAGLSGLSLQLFTTLDSL